MATDSSDTSSLMTVAELIDATFGQHEVNVVHHKYLQTVLFLLARQLRILERRVTVKMGAAYPLEITKSSSSLSVTEVKLRALSKKIKGAVKDKKLKSTDKGPWGLQGGKQLLKSTEAKQITRSNKENTLSEIVPKINDTMKPVSEKTYSSTGTAITTSTYKTSTDMASSDIISSDIKSSEKTSSDKISTSRTFSDKTSTDKTSTSAKRSSDITSSDKISPEKTSDQTASSVKTSIAKSGTTKTLTGKTSLETSSNNDGIDKYSEKLLARHGKRSNTTELRTMGPQDYQKLLDEVEETRERELRIIHQRANSREQREKTPTPIASMDSVEVTYEKLLIVERVSPEEAEARAARDKSSTRKGEAAPRISVVTQEEFEELATTVRNIQKKIAPIGTSDFPENAVLMQELRKGASLTDAMAALQLSARLEATEKTLKNMLSLVTELARQTSGIDVSSEAYDDVEVLFGATDGKKRKENSGTAYKQPKTQPIGTGYEFDAATSLSELPVPTSLPKTQIDTSVQGYADENEGNDDKVTNSALKQALKDLQNEIMKMVTGLTTQSNVNADNALKLANKLEGKIQAALNLGTKMENLECLITDYADQINVLDTGFSSQMTNYQEELTQMQHDLETGLETMAEVLANTGGDATAVAELNAHFGSLQTDIDNTLAKQNELREIQYNFATDLSILRKRIELLSETKSDREEVADALRDKAGLEALNGLISYQQFNAVRGDLEKRIRAAYDKFNNQEIIWQKAIDDLQRELHEKADLVQVEGLRDAINRHLQDFREKLKFIKDIVGEPQAAALARKINRDAACLSCSAPACMKVEEETMPKLPPLRPPTIGAEGPKPKEDGDHGLCYPGYHIPHQIDPRAHVCKRWCGGSHTLLTSATSRVPPSVHITALSRKAAVELGMDGKPYMVDEPIPKEPCVQCAIPPTPSREPLDRQQRFINEDPTDMVPFDFRQTITSAQELDITPPTTFYTD